MSSIPRNDKINIYYIILYYNTQYLLVAHTLNSSTFPLVILILFLGQGQWSVVFWSLGRSSSCLAKVERRFRITREGEGGAAVRLRVAITLDTALLGKKGNREWRRAGGFSTYPCFIALVAVVGLLALDAKLVQKQILLEKSKLKSISTKSLSICNGNARRELPDRAPSPFPPLALSHSSVCYARGNTLQANVNDSIYNVYQWVLKQ